MENLARVDDQQDALQLLYRKIGQIVNNANSR
ncbi:hypothetical protein SAMN05216316_2570 [Nitrosovibrio sp. Nv6]|nr:hypothetical protein SAMN05216316_2570 [Nitrosovibrio sp. Nv6]